MSDHPKQKHILEYLKSIAQLHRAQFIERSKHEWKIVFMTLTTYTLIVAATHSQSLHFPNTLPFLILGTAFIAGLALVSIFYLLFMHRWQITRTKLSQKRQNARCRHT